MKYCRSRGEKMFYFEPSKIEDFFPWSLKEESDFKIQIAVLQQFPIVEKGGILYREHFICLYFCNLNY